jgi:hypothetical protein
MLFIKEEVGYSIPFEGCIKKKIIAGISSIFF